MPPVASIPRIARILTIVAFVLQHPDDATVEEICRRFRIDPDQLSEDLTLLAFCGLPPFSPGDLIETDIVDGRVVIGMADYLADPLRLTRFEAVSLLAAGRALAALPALADAPALSSALAKVAAAIAPDDAEAAAMLAERIEIELEPASPEILDALRDAIEARRSVQIEYYSLGRDEMTSRVVDPLVVSGSRPWYLTAHDHRSGEQRTFRVDRIRSLKPAETTFAWPDGFDANAAAAAPLYRPSPGDAEVVLDLAPAARWVAELTPHDSLKPQTDGVTRMTLRASATGWLARLLLQLGPDAAVVKPESLAAEVRALADAALARYDG